MTATLVVGLGIQPAGAARAQAQAAPALRLATPAPRPSSPFPEVPLESSQPRSHAWAYAALGAGAALVGLSFVLDRRADRTYEDYLHQTDPAEIDRLYRRTVFQDRLSTGSLLSGQGLLVLGVYVRFLRGPHPGGADLALGPARCAVSYRF